MLVAVNNEPPPPPVAAEVQPVVGGVQHRLSQPVPAGCQRLALLTRKNLCELFLSEAAMARLLPLEARLRELRGREDRPHASLLEGAVVRIRHGARYQLCRVGAVEAAAAADGGSELRLHLQHAPQGLKPYALPHQISRTSSLAAGEAYESGGGRAERAALESRMAAEGFKGWDLAQTARAAWRLKVARDWAANLEDWWRQHGPANLEYGLVAPAGVTQTMEFLDSADVPFSPPVLPKPEDQPQSQQAQPRQTSQAAPRDAPPADASLFIEAVDLLLKALEAPDGRRWQQVSLEWLASRMHALSGSSWTAPAVLGIRFTDFLQRALSLPSLRADGYRLHWQRDKQPSLLVAGKRQAADSQRFNEDNPVQASAKRPRLADGLGTKQVATHQPAKLDRQPQPCTPVADRPTACQPAACQPSIAAPARQPPAPASARAGAAKVPLRLKVNWVASCLSLQLTRGLPIDGGQLGNKMKAMNGGVRMTLEDMGGRTLSQVCQNMAAEGLCTIDTSGSHWLITSLDFSSLLRNTSPRFLRAMVR